MGPMEIRYLCGGEDGPELFGDDYATYEEASAESRQRARRGITQVIYKAVPVARFVASVTVEEQVCES